ncbi:MAG: hypothetical protein IKI71_03530 [Lachnospiraceae bacterium]|nr:hypothetical protein [Lachnospiraceae bacterium]
MKRICKCLIIILICFISINSYATQLDYSRIYYDKDNYYKSTWQWLDLNSDRIYECYYFNVLGHMYKNGTTPDGYQVNENGEWVVDGIVQRKTSVEVKDLIDVNIATVSSAYNTKYYVIIDVKKDFSEELDSFIDENVFDVRNYIVSKDVDKKLLVDLQGQYIKNMNNIYNTYYKQIVELFDKNEITKQDLNESKNILSSVLKSKEKLLKQKISELAKDITWQFSKDELKEKRELVLDKKC